ncbi:putative inositol-tetrakisphosphate 1-kinase 3 [Paratrimastix pyriformis]|uniref:Inositol-tetrakisphosphate 1-kinase 3 n=1 Tax=Paratrimastix pyriformis TaxID=342808 RepID=A0ABQ8UBS3_9EUKA|nr:putative inositol-tetrakisphosphate 1-kinase 3 [Paratrimastix pyriformis]
MQPLLVGFIFSPKKIGHPTFRSLIEATRKFARVVIIDFSRPIEEQGDFNVIYHKLTDWMSAANEETKRLLERFDRYCAAHPAVRIVEPVHNLDVLLDRVSTCEAFAHFDVTVTAPPAPAPDSPHTFRVRWPASVVVSRDRPGTPEAFRQAGLEFPVVAKPAMACGLTLKAHQFVLAYEMADLERAGILESPEPYLLQRLVPHRGAVHKVYVIGDHVECALRDSLPPALHAAATATTEWRTFNSQKMGPSGVALTETTPPLGADALTPPAHRYHPAGYHPAGYHPAGYHPAGYHPAGYHPAGYHPAGYHPAGYHPAGYQLSPSWYHPAGITSPAITPPVSPG